MSIIEPNLNPIVFLPIPLDKEKIEFLQQQVRALGGLDVGVVKLLDDPHYESYLEWIKNEHHQPLDYLARNQDLRKNPARLGEKLKSAVVVLFAYPENFYSRHIARYARGPDYHPLLKEKLKELSVRFSKKFAKPEEERFCVDTAPLLERSLAQRAGLGWIGKNGCLISKKAGSFTLIATWLSSLDCENEQSEYSSHCGSCTRCISACPTQAFIKEGQLEVSRCLSMQSIENRKIIPVEFHSHFKHSAFGCDICQEVCPWNRKFLGTKKEEYLPPLNELLSLAEPDFRAFFRHSALERPGWHGLRRNFLIAAAAEGVLSQELLNQHLHHSSQLLKETAKQLLDSLAF